MTVEQRDLAPRPAGRWGRQRTIGDYQALKRSRLTPSGLVRRGCPPAVDERTVGIMTLTVVIVLLILVCGAASFVLWRRRSGR